MKNSKRISIVLLFIVAFSASWIVAQSPMETINQLGTQLREKPGDAALREQIIKLAVETKPALAIPETAREHFVEGNTLAKAAKDVLGQKLAVESFREALKIAPWWGEAYYNLAVAQGLAGFFDDAQSSLKFYILTDPGEKEAREAQDKIYEFKAKKKLADAEAAQKEAQRRAAEDTPEAREKRFFDSIEGAMFTRSEERVPMDRKYNPGDIMIVHRIVIRNREILKDHVQWWSSEPSPDVTRASGNSPIRAELRGRVINYKSGNDANCNTGTWTLSPDGRTITEDFYCFRSYRATYIRIN